VTLPTTRRCEGRTSRSLVGCSCSPVGHDDASSRSVCGPRGCIAVRVACRRLAADATGFLATTGHGRGTEPYPATGGDLLIGNAGWSAIVTRIERTTRCTYLSRSMTAPQWLCTRARGEYPTIAGDLAAEPHVGPSQEHGRPRDLQCRECREVCFFDPSRLCWRATNENNNGLLRQYFSNATDTSRTTTNVTSTPPR